MGGCGPVNFQRVEIDAALINRYPLGFPIVVMDLPPALHDLKTALRGWVLEKRHRLQLMWTLWRVREQNPILVYQMGKVGSRTVVEALRALDLNAPVIHLHTLNPEGLARAIRKERHSPSPHLPRHLVASQMLTQKMKSGRFPCRVITLTREPIGRAVSFAFEDWRKKAPDALSDGGELDTSQMATAVAEMLNSENGHSDPGLWFESELKGRLGIDVFSTPYRFDQGFTILPDNDTPALVIRLEDLDRSLRPALASFMDVPSNAIKMHQTNVGSEKWYAESLRQVKQSFTLPEPVIQRILGTRYVDHFYPAEKNKLHQRWSDACQRELKEDV